MHLWFGMEILYFIHNLIFLPQRISDITPNIKSYLCTCEQASAFKSFININELVYENIHRRTDKGL